MRQCYSLNDPNWDCDKWLKETVKPDCLPERKNGSPKCARNSPRRVTRGKLHTGPRGGKYYLIGQTKVYVK